jgi:peptidyl-prolyl cis-trans isomerase B (cyclophilin B)
MQSTARTPNGDSVPQPNYLEGLRLMANRIATLETTKGVVKFELYEDLAPVTAQNFIELAEKGFYDGLKFHRYVAGFVIQGGDPVGNGSGGSGRTIPLEVTPQLRHDGAGVVAMARSQNPNSASSQFYITLAPASFLDNQYAVFGRVTEGLNNALALREGDKMTRVTIEAL